MSWQISTRTGKNDRGSTHHRDRFERGGVNNTNIVVSYAGFLSAYGEFDEALALLSDHKPAENNQKIISTILEMCT